MLHSQVLKNRHRFLESLRFTVVGKESSHIPLPSHMHRLTMRNVPTSEQCNCYKQGTYIDTPLLAVVHRLK